MSARDQILLTWREITVEGKIIDNAHMFCGGPTKQGDYKFGMKVGDTEKARWPNEEDLQVIDTIVEQLKLSYRPKVRWWRKMLANFGVFNHNGHNLHR